MMRQFLSLFQKAKQVRKPLLLSLLFSCLMCNYHLLHNLKDTLAVNAHLSGAEVLPVLKFFGVLPLSLLFVIFYTRFSYRIHLTTLFYGLLGIFIGFFFFFTFILFPHLEAHDHSGSFLMQLSEQIPRFKWIIIALMNWPISIFYILAELWGVVFLSFFFWALANEISNIKEAKTFYPFIIFISHFSTLSAGAAVIYFSSHHFFTQVSQIRSITISLMILVTSFALGSIFFFESIRKTYMEDQNTLKVSKKKKPSFQESLGDIFHSRHLRFLLIMIVAYSLCSNMVEVHWKALAHKLLPLPEQYSRYMGSYNFWLGTLSSLFSLIVAVTNHYFSWSLTALLTPLFCGLLGVTYFISFFLSQKAPHLLPLADPLLFTLSIGFLQSLLTRSFKYTYFDMSKEIVYLNLPHELKKKGKAAVDVAGSRLGKSGSSALQNILLIVTAGSQFTIAPFTSFVFFLFLILWFFGIQKLSSVLQKNETLSKN